MGSCFLRSQARRVWNRVQEDSAGLRNYYEDHKQDFLTEKAMDAKIYTLRSSGGDKKLSSSYRKFSRKPGCDSLMLRKFNKENDSLLVIKEGRFDVG